VDIVQAVGRAMRKPRGASSKTTGYIILPVFLSKKELKDPETAVEGSAFAPVLQVLRALKAHDPYRATFFAKILVEEGKRPHKKGDGIDEILGVSIGKELNRVLAKRLEKAVQLRAVEVVAQGFEHGIAALDSFIAEKGRANVPVQTIHHGFALGKWISHQRNLRSLNMLTNERILALEKRGMAWSAPDQAWKEAIASYQEHVRRNGKDAVPAQGGTPNLLNWVRSQRTAYANGQLSVDRIAELEQIGITWAPKNTAWDLKLASLSFFIAKHKHTRVPRDYVDLNGVKLGAWVSDMRKRRKLTDNRQLSAQQLEQLEGLGFVWNEIYEKWESGLRHLSDYLKKFGSADVPGRYVSPDGFKLGQWVQNKRREREGRLNEAQKRSLSELGFVWKPKVGSRKVRLTSRKL
jgi:hypothetical protein